MKTKAKNLFSMLTALFAVVSLTMISCDDDDDDIDLPKIGGYDKSDDIASTNLVAKFSFEDDINDAQGNVTDGSSSNTSFVEGAVGKAWQGSTNGYTVYGSPGTKLTGLSSFTVAFWIKTSVHTEGAEALFMLSNESSWIGNLFVLQESGTEGVDSIRLKIKFDNWDAAAWKEQWIEISGEYRLTGMSDTWVHLALTYDGSSSKFYVYLNGAKRELPDNFTNRYEDDPESGGAALGNLKFNNATKFIFGAYQNMVGIGGDPDTWMKNFDGQLDEFRIYDKALIDTDIDALFQLEKAGR